ncbi:MAG TPA: hypothetical protein VIX17_18190 [Pyrinomonadaceae bacterium]
MRKLLPEYEYANESYGEVQDEPESLEIGTTLNLTMGSLDGSLGVLLAQYTPRQPPSERSNSSRERAMCPVCIANTAVVVVGTGFTGGILAVCIAKFRKVFRESGLGLFQKTKEK